MEQKKQINILLKKSDEELLRQASLSLSLPLVTFIRSSSIQAARLEIKNSGGLS